jgi:hypothetical protein
MFASGVPVGSRPVKVALVSEVAALRVKSSAVSVWMWPAPAGRDSVPINPSGIPVLNEKGAAEADGIAREKAINPA